MIYARKVTCSAVTGERYGARGNRAIGGVCIAKESIPSGKRVRRCNGLRRSSSVIRQANICDSWWSSQGIDALSCLLDIPVIYMHNLTPTSWDSTLNAYCMIISSSFLLGYSDGPWRACFHLNIRIRNGKYSGAPLSFKTATCHRTTNRDLVYEIFLSDGFRWVLPIIYVLNACQRLRG